MRGWNVEVEFRGERVAVFVSGSMKRDRVMGERDIEWWFAGLGTEDHKALGITQDEYDDVTGQVIDALLDTV